MYLANPYLWSIIEGMWATWLPPEGNYEWLRKLVAAWVQGATVGACEVSVLPVRAGRRGQTPLLFPHLPDRHGWFETAEALQDKRDAGDFRRTYDDLMVRLKGAVQWKAVRNDYREFAREGKDQAPIVDDVATAVAATFKEFSTTWHLKTKPPEGDALRRIVRAGLNARRGGNPRHMIACGLLAALPWRDRNGNTLRLTPGLVASTLDTLRKYGIPSTDAQIIARALKAGTSGP